ncbi:MAG: metallophosphoesterase [Nitrososphaerales archaeon]
MKIKTLYEQRAILLQPNEDARYLVITDLHIGFEERFRGAGVHIQSNIDEMVSELESLVDDLRVTNLIVNGDVKSGIDRILESEWDNVPRFFSRISKKCRVSVIPGNHDGGLSNLLPHGVELQDINGMLLEDTLILHGHTRPLIKFKDCKRLIIGHIHPIFQKKGSPLSGQPVWVFLKVSKKAIFREILDQDIDADSLFEVVVMPPFNRELFSAGFRPEDERGDRNVSSLAKDLKLAEDAVVITLKGEVIGDKSLLASML